MKPFLFSHTFFEVPTYYILYLLAFLGAIVLASRRAVRFGLNPVRAVDLGLVAFIAGVIGARIFHVFGEFPDYYFRHPIRVFYFWQGGFVLFGGIFAGVLAGYLFLKHFKEPVGRWADVAAPAVLLGIGIGRGGCLAAGCCYGAPTHWFWGMTFSDPRSAAPLNIPLHPTQLLEMLFAFLACGVFLLVFRKPPKLQGSSMVWALIVYSLFRFGIEFIRGDSDRGFYFGGVISTSQIISLITILGCIVWFACHKRLISS